jgi:DUF971 family protein
MHTVAPIAGTQPTAADQALYQAGRQGDDFSYAIPVTPGLYSLRLKFAETEHEWSLERPLNLAVNGREVLSNFDVAQAARGARQAHERVLRYLVPDADGHLILRFTAGHEPGRRPAPAMVQAIEVLPELKPTVRLDCGSEKAFVDWNSSVWSPDAPPQGSHALRSDAPVAQASPTLHDQRLYQTGRAGRDLRYAVTVPPGLYTVHLKFAELWLGEPGKRPLNVEINGRRVREAWDPATAAGQVAMAADIRVEDVTPDHHGQIAIRVLAAGAEEAILQAIEVE